MKAKFALLPALILAALLLSCSDNDGISSNGGSQTEGLLGLSVNHTNVYQQFDSLITYTPTYQITVDTSIRTFSVYEAGPNQNMYDIAVSDEMLARLIITSKSVAMTGFYQEIEGEDSLFYFIDIPEILPSRISASESWSYYVPPIYRNGQPQITNYLNYGFGYEIMRTYMGKEDIVVPAGAYTANIIQTEYRLRGTAEVVRTDKEYLVSGIGLIRMYSSGSFGKSHVLMISSDYDD